MEKKRRVLIIPYPILVFSAMLPWQYFANAMSYNQRLV